MERERERERERETTTLGTDRPANFVLCPYKVLQLQEC